MTDSTSPATALTLSAFGKKTKALRASTAPRLIFALDATASRAPTWAAAQNLTETLLHTAADLGNLEMQVGYFRALSDCQFSHWSTDAKELVTLMRGIHCASGTTQIQTVLQHALTEANAAPTRLKALVFVGDTFEEQGRRDEILHLAKMLGDLRVPIFMFLERTSDTGREDRTTYEAISRASGGATVDFQEGAIAELRKLLQMVATLAVGGIDALKKLPGATLLLEQMKGPQS